MYPQFFGFDKLPFRLRPDPDFLYSGQEYQRARAQVLTALQRGPRIVLLMGPPGVGKTLLLEDVLGEVKGQCSLCRINQPHISATELLQALLLQLGVAPADPESGQPRLFAELAESLDPLAARNAAPLLIIDDAQLLGAATLRTFGEILDRVPRLKILLVLQGGPQSRTEDLAASMRVIEPPGQVHLHPLAADATQAYVERRLAVAGSTKELFTADAFATIFQHTGGAPRLINVLCDAALHAACMRASGHVSGAEILLATQDSRWPEALARDKARVGVAAQGAPAPGAPAEKAAAEDATAEDAPSAVAQLLVTHGTKHIAAWPVKPGRISIGRAPDNELRLEAQFISRHHCQVVTVGNVSTIEDLGSVNGISVNGKAVKRHVLQHNDQITLGEHVLTYRLS
jgi:type II secretory pathway predicted ATPase ExeA